MPAELKAKLEEAAAASGRSLNAEIVHCLQSWLEFRPRGGAMGAKGAPAYVHYFFAKPDGPIKAGTFTGGAETPKQDLFADSPILVDKSGVDEDGNRWVIYEHKKPDDMEVARHLAEQISDPANREHVEMLTNLLVGLLEPKVRHGLREVPFKSKLSKRKTEEHS